MDRCVAVLREATERIVAEGHADSFDDALVDLIAAAPFIDRRLMRPDTLERIAAVTGRC